MTDRIVTVDASPVKEFFIDILTRDISLVAAILDLVDNSVDSARSMRPNGDLTGVHINVVAKPGEFSIEDNCGGIGVQNAKDYVFRMGRPDDAVVNPGSIGQFGVGLKRGLFKLGSSFIVHSATELDSFTIDLNVAAWVDEAEWSFPMNVHDDAAPSERGTTIIVDSLHARVAEAFSDDETLETLRQELQSRHRLAVTNGLNLTLNGTAIPKAESTVALSELIAPAVRTFDVPTFGDGMVSVRIVVGVSARPADDVDEDGEPESQPRAAVDAGWLVFGNGRLLLANDKTSLTGWGSGRNNIPQYHNQFARFRGFVYMDSVDSNAIPWNTMKTGVDSDSKIWRLIRQAMIDAARDVIKLLNYAKVERHIGLASAGVQTPILDALNAAGPRDASEAAEEITIQYSMSITELRGGLIVAASYPEPNADLVAALKKIQYQVDSSSFDDLATALGTSSAAEIGRQSFEDFYAKHVGS
jgi:hypothetical protein